MKKIVFIFLIFCIGGILIFAFTTRVGAEKKGNAPSCSWVGPCGECNNPDVNHETCCKEKEEKEMCKWIGDKNACCPKLEVDWPTSPGGHNINGCSTLPELIRYLYEWGIGIGGLVLFVALIWAGISMMMSVGKPIAWRDAKNRMVSALIGMGLLLGSYLILNFINPELTQLKMPNIEELEIEEVCAKCNEATSTAEAKSCCEKNEECMWIEEEGRCYPLFLVEFETKPCSTTIVYTGEDFTGRHSDEIEITEVWTPINLESLWEKLFGWLPGIGATPIRSLKLLGPPKGESCLKTGRCQCEVGFYEDPGCSDDKLLFFEVTSGRKSIVSAKEPIKCIKIRQLPSF